MSLDEFLREYVEMYGFETRLVHSIGNNRGREILADMGLKCITVNLGHTNSKMFDSVWRKECPFACPESEDGEIDWDSDCLQCHGKGYIEPYDLMLSYVWNGKNHKWDVSIYSTKPEIDCSAIARAFGGNGSMVEASFQCERLPFEI